LNRRHDWADKMFSTIKDHESLPFEYGKNDCCSFVARIVDAMCDTEHEKALLQNYHDEPTALEYIKRSGGIEKAVEAYIGIAKQGRPHRGDVVLIHVNDRDALGICIGREIAVKTTDGVSYVDRSVLLKFWSI